MTAIEVENQLNLVLIPTACLVDQEMQSEVGRIAPVLIPINGKPILELIVDKYRSLPGTTHYVLAVHEGKDPIQDYLNRRAPGDKISLLNIGKTKDLAETIENSLKLLEIDSFSNLFINFGDTLIEAALNQEQDTLYCDIIPESYRWATFEQDSSGIKIVDKFNSDLANYQSVFTGVFLFKQPTRFLTCLNQAVESDNLGRFYVALKNYLKESKYTSIKVIDWFDFGHIDNYFSSKKKFINKRFFNQIKIDEHRAILEKRSTHLQKFFGEIKWYLEIPSGLRCYLPQVYDYSLCGEESFIKLEYYGYPPLSDLYASGGHSLSIWNHVFQAIFRLRSEMNSYCLRPNRETIHKALFSMYVTKTLDRLESLKDHPVLAPYINKKTVINGRNYPALSKQLDQLPELVENILIKSLDEFRIIHGDICLSNILFDPKSRIIKLVDPRGQFGEQTIYGDFRYDLAKLSHSFHGHYELMISDSFFTICNEQQIDYTLFKTAQQEALKTTFERHLNKEYPGEMQAIRLIESLLFLSMVPLHQDYLNRQIIMLATGIEQFNLSLESYRNSK